MRNLARRLGREEDGVAVAIALGILALMSIFATGVLATTVSTSDSSEREKSTKRALAAAEAGVQQATFRVNRLAPANGLCVTDVVTLPLVGDLCPEITENVGDGAKVKYRVSPILTLSDQCAGLPVQTTENGKVTIVQRCIVAIGDVGGVKRRVQARVAAFQGNPVFPLPGIIGLESVELKNTGYVNGWVGSNGQVKMVNSGTITGGLELGPSAPAPVIGGGWSTTNGVKRRTPTQGGWVLAPVEIGNSVTSNHNFRITNGLASPKIPPFDTSTNVSYNAATRVLTMGNNSSLTLGGGTYNFCNVVMGNNSQIVVAAKPAGQPQGVRIFVDSPYRAGSGCPAGSGNLTMGQGATFSTPPGGDPQNLQMYVYGWSSSENPVANQIEFNNSGWVGAFYAPQSTVVFNNTAVLKGGLAAKKVEFKNGVTFDWADSIGNIRARTLTLFYRTAWKECTPDPLTTDPDSGC